MDSSFHVRVLKWSIGFEVNRPQYDLVFGFVDLMFLMLFTDRFCFDARLQGSI